MSGMTDELVPIMIPEALNDEIDTCAREEGLSRDSFAAEALKKYLFIKRFRSLRKELMSDLSRSYTDEEIFDLVS